MRTNFWYASLHWTARIWALLVAGFVFSFYFGEAAGPNGKLVLIPSNLSLRDGTLLFLVLASAVAIILAWFWERWAGTADVLLAGAFLFCCVAMQSMRRVWPLGLALLIPGLLFVGAAAIRRHPARVAQ